MLAKLACTRCVRLVVSSRVVELERASVLWFLFLPAPFSKIQKLLCIILKFRGATFFPRFNREYGDVFWEVFATMLL